MGWAHCDRRSYVEDIRGRQEGRVREGVMMTKQGLSDMRKGPGAKGYGRPLKATEHREYRFCPRAYRMNAAPRGHFRPLTSRTVR